MTATGSRSRRWSAAADVATKIAGAERAGRLLGATLYVITDAQPRLQPVEEFLRATIQAGAGMVQLREKHLSDAELVATARRFATACQEYGALFIVNDRVDVALACGADGVHLGQDDLPPTQARRLAGPDLLVGLSTHDREQIDASENEPVDYIAVGPVYATPTKPERAPVGVELVEYAHKRAKRPFFAIGGIDPNTIVAVTNAGAQRVAVLRTVAGALDPGEATRALTARLRAAG